MKINNFSSVVFLLSILSISTNIAIGAGGAEDGRFEFDYSKVKPEQLPGAEMAEGIQKLTAVFEEGGHLDPKELEKIHAIIQNFNPGQIKDEKLKEWLKVHGKEMIADAKDLEYASNVLEQLGLRKKLIAIENNPTEVDSLAWWMNREPLRSYQVGRGRGRTAKQIAESMGLDRIVLMHKSQSPDALERIRSSGQTNVFVSRTGTSGEAAPYGNGFYTKRFKPGKDDPNLLKSPQTVVEVLRPDAREGTDFHIEGDYVVLQNKRAAAPILGQSEIAAIAATPARSMEKGPTIEISVKHLLDDSSIPKDGNFYYEDDFGVVHEGDYSSGVITKDSGTGELFVSVDKGIPKGIIGSGARDTFKIVPAKQAELAAQYEKASETRIRFEDNNYGEHTRLFINEHGLVSFEFKKGTIPEHKGLLKALEKAWDQAQKSGRLSHGGAHGNIDMLSVAVKDSSGKKLYFQLELDPSSDGGVELFSKTEQEFQKGTLNKVELALNDKLVAADDALAILADVQKPSAHAPPGSKTNVGATHVGALETEEAPGVATETPRKGKIGKAGGAAVVVVGAALGAAAIAVDKAQAQETANEAEEEKPAQ